MVPVDTASRVDARPSIKGFSVKAVAGLHSFVVTGSIG
jgi:hypothetical protein